MKDLIYLDYNATCITRPEAHETASALLLRPYNASAVHAMGREGRKLIEQARDTIAEVVNAPKTGVIFNSGATEANNTVLKFFKPNERILISKIEHPSVYEVAKNADHINVTKDGTMDLTHLEELLKQEPKAALVSVMAVNNETGVIQPIKEISDLTHKHGALLHCDAVQAVGRMHIDMQAMGIDILSLSAHKLGGPQGVGALVLGNCGFTPILMEGGGQEKSARAGTENIAGIAGFAAAAREAHDGWQNSDKKLSSLRQKLETGIKRISPEAIIYGENAQRTANTTMFSVPGFQSGTLLMNFDLEGFCISSGSACSSGKVQNNRVLTAMGASEAEASGALRISTGWASDEADIDAFLNAWEKIYKRMTERVKGHA